MADERRQCQVGWGCVRKDVAEKPRAAPGEEVGLSPGHSAGRGWGVEGRRHEPMSPGCVRPGREGPGYPAEACCFSPGGTVGSLGKRKPELCFWKERSVGPGEARVSGMWKDQRRREGC